jgi:hypothetical protein
MRNDIRIFMAGLVAPLFGALPCRAQEKSPDATPRFYVGVHHLYNTGYQVFYPDTPGSAGVHPWQLTAGGNVSTRLAIQIGFSYQNESKYRDPLYTGTRLNGDYIEGFQTSKRWTYCVPVLVRYAVVRYPKPRLQVDVLLGLTLLGTESSYEVEDRVNGQVVRQYSYGGKATQGYYTAGVGFRYPFGRHFEGVLDWTYNRNFRSTSEGVNFNTTGNRYGFTRAINLGVRYRFNVRKKPAAS